MVSSYCLSGGAGDPLVAFGGDGPRSYAELYASAREVATGLDGSGSEPLLLCQDRFRFAAAMLGAWMCGRSVALPHNRSEGAIAKLRERSGTVLHDDDSLKGEPGALDVRRWDGSADSDSAPLAVELPESQALVTVYSSGTSGDATAWSKNARQMIGEAQCLAEVFGIAAGDRVVCTVPSQHIYGLLFGVLVPLVAGASFSRHTPSSVQSMLDQTEEHQGSVLVSVPPQWRAMSMVATRPLASVRLGVSSGAKLLADVAAEARAQLGVDITEVLGSTETGGIGTKTADDGDSYLPLPGISVRAEDGCLRLISPFVEEPRQEFQSADRIEILAGGRFRHLGRDDGLTKVGAKRVTLQEVEKHALEIDGVTDAVVLRVEVGGLRESELWLAVQSRTATPKSIRANLQQCLDGVLVPRKIRVLPRLPRGPAGKLPRSIALELFEGQKSVAPVSTAPLATESFPIRVPASSPRFVGHFPGDAILPAVAQLHDLVLPKVRDSFPQLGSLQRMNRVRFTSPVRPDTDMELTLKHAKNSQRVDFELRAAEIQYAKGTLYFAGGQ
ncbi:MAG: AMP-binding protein [Polyangiaceae bacterium]|nr:AMP-binding protein [Polyangiaceae bacterium]